MGPTKLFKSKLTDIESPVSTITSDQSPNDTSEYWFITWWPPYAEIGPV